MAQQPGFPGDIQRGLSILFICERVRDDLFVCPGESVYDVEPRIRKRTETVVCPRDKRLGSAYVDAADDKHAGLSNLMLSYTWGYKVDDIISALASYCTSRTLAERDTRVWICCFCINQHRVKEEQKAGGVTFEVFRETFGARVMAIKRIVALLSPWNKPAYITRVWCLFEAWMSTRFQGVLVDFVMPPVEEGRFMAALSEANGLSEVWDALNNVDVSKAEASIPLDKERILELINRDGGYESLNCFVRKQVKTWLVQTARSLQKDLSSSSRLQVLQLADFFTQLSMHDDCIALLRESMVAFSRAADAAEFHLRIGRSFGNLGDQDQAQKECQLALGLLRSSRPHPGVPLREEAEVLRTIGAVNRKRAHLDEAFHCYSEALAILQREAVNGELCSGAAWILVSLALVRNRADERGMVIHDLRPASEYLDEAEHLHHVHKLTDKPAHAYLLLNRGDALVNAGGFDEAEALYDEAERLLHRLVQTRSEVFATLALSRALLNKRLGRHAQAAEYFEKMHDTFQALQRADKRSVIAERSCEVVLHLMGDSDGARRLSQTSASRQVPAATLEEYLSSSTILRAPVLQERSIVMGQLAAITGFEPAALDAWLATLGHDDSELDILTAVRALHSWASM